MLTGAKIRLRAAGAACASAATALCRAAYADLLAATRYARSLRGAQE